MEEYLTFAAHTPSSLPVKCIPLISLFLSLSLSVSLSLWTGSLPISSNLQKKMDQGQDSKAEVED